jgi:hypothetical protein
MQMAIIKQGEEEVEEKEKKKQRTVNHLGSEIEW